MSLLPFPTFSIGKLHKSDAHRWFACHIRLPEWMVDAPPHLAQSMWLLFYDLRLLNEVTQDLAQSCKTMEVFSVGFFYFLSFQMMTYLNVWTSCYEDVVNLIIGLDELFSCKRLKSRFPSLLL
jgi:hypothetical protein